MRHLALLAFTLFAIPAWASTNVELYRSEVILDQQVDNPDAQARIDGMKEVIVRASGDRNAISNAVVQKALKQNSQYLTQISYGQVEDQPSLRMGFSSEHIRSLLSQAQLPVWPADRANLLVWLVEEKTADRNIVWEHSESEKSQQMKLVAEKRGLPLTLPIGDFDDITGVAVSDLWGGFARPVGEASQRYPVEAVLVIRAQTNSLRWTLYDQKPSTIGITRQAPLSGSANGSDAVTKMIHQVSDYYAEKNAVVVASESSESIKVRFTQLKDAIGFFNLENSLKKLSSVASIDILKIQGNEVTFNVHLLSSQQEFEQEVLRVAPVVQLESEIEGGVEPLPQITQPEPAPGVNELNDVTSPAEGFNPTLIEESLPSENVLPALDQPVVAQIPETVLVFEWQGVKTPAPQVNMPEDKVEEPQPAILGSVEESEVQ